MFTEEFIPPCGYESKLSCIGLREVRCMTMRKMLRQTLFLSGAHFVVRVMGFIMRIWLSRELGAAAMGIVELAQNAQMLLITPVISGLPASISRMCAQSECPRQLRILRCGVLLALAVSIPLMIAAFLLRVPLALWLGSLQTLPALIVYLPCIPILGVSCALNGYYYGTGRPVPPALSEVLEQAVRFLLCMRLVSMLRAWPMVLLAAIPALGALIGELAGLLLMLLCAARLILGRIPEKTEPMRGILREMLSLALPLTGMKCVSSLIRTVQSVMIPARLVSSGLAQREAMSLLGMMNGMMMPIIMLPSFVICSLSMVASPELSRRQAQGRPLNGIMRRTFTAALGISLPAMAAVCLLAPFFSLRLYRQAELLPLLRRCCPLVPVMALGHVAGAMMNGLGLQAKSLRISLFSGLISLLTGYVLTAIPQLRLWGAVIALAAGQLVSLSCSAAALHSAVQKRSMRMSFQRSDQKTNGIC